MLVCSLFEYVANMSDIFFNSSLLIKLSIKFDIINGKHKILNYTTDTKQQSKSRFSKLPRAIPANPINLQQSVSNTSQPRHVRSQLIIEIKTATPQ